ncbi:hypothetical protein H9L25_00360 [Terrisporobacter mayombei]|nr:hypothetical protein [Terrisporobacter mayombei]
MRCKKCIVFILVCLISIIYNYKINKIVATDTRNDIEIKHKVVEKPKEISKEEKELNYWSKVTGENVTKVTEIECKLSFYTSLARENAGYENLTASGSALYPGVIANNMYPFDTDIYIEGFGICQVKDRGGKGLSTYNNFDVYIPRNYGESDLDYYDRVNDMGIKTVKGYILEFN